MADAGSAADECRQGWEQGTRWRGGVAWVKGWRSRMWVKAVARRANGRARIAGSLWGTVGQKRLGCTLWHRKTWLCRKPYTFIGLCTAGRRQFITEGAYAKCYCQQHGRRCGVGVVRPEGVGRALAKPQAMAASRPWSGWTGYGKRSVPSSRIRLPYIPSCSSWLHVLMLAHTYFNEWHA